MFERFDDILTIEDLAEVLKIGTTQAYKLVRSNKIKAFKEGKDWKISKTGLIAYVRNKAESNIASHSPLSVRYHYLNYIL